MERGGELDELAGVGDVALEEDHGADFVGCDEGFDVFACDMAVEADDEKLVSISKARMNTIVKQFSDFI